MDLVKRYWKKSIIVIALASIFTAGAIYIRPILSQIAQNLNPNREIDTRSITISPLIFELSANPGDIVKNNLKVSNSGNTNLTINMEVEDFTAVGEGGSVIVQERDNDTYSLSKWVTIEPESFDLRPGEQRLVEFSITVPFNGEPGGHYGSILVNAAPPEVVSGPALAQKAGSLVLLSVAGEVQENVIVKEFSAPAFLEKGPVDFLLRFENRGSVHIRPRGFVTITNMFGKKEADIPFPQKNVLPNSIRKIDASWEPVFAIGRYTATLVANYGTDNLPLAASVRFWVFPWKMGLLILVVVIIILMIFIKSRRRLGLAFRVLFKGDK